MKSQYLFRSCSLLRTLALLLVCAAIVTGCSSNTGSDVAGVGTGGTGSLAKLDITDTPATDYAHVYVTVRSVAFHTDSAVAFSGYSSSKASGWQIFDLPAPKTIDLAQLTNGTMYADLNGNSSLFSGMSLPLGSYRQIRIFLASTEYSYVGSVPGLVYNNEVQIIGDSAHYPLRIPTSEEGIRVIPESPVVMTSGSDVSLALDFNLNNDVVAVSPNGATEFMLKPRLALFDLGRVGAVKGAVSFSNLSTSNIEVKAEQVKSGTNYRIVRRATSIDKTTGKFTLYPLPLFGNATTAVYDILLRGKNVQTAIIKGVKIHAGSTPANGVDMGSVVMQPGTEFTAQLGSGMHPSGAWLNFYQTIAGDSASYEVRYRHLDPYTGIMGKPIELSAGPIRVASYAPGSSLAFIADITSQGKFSMTADAADMYDAGAALSGISGTVGKNVTITTSAANYPQVNSAATPGSINCIFDMSLLGTGRGPGMGMGNLGIGYPPKGQVFVTRGGMIIDSIGDLTGNTMVGGAMQKGGGTSNPVALSNLPANIPTAIYGVYVLGWGNGFLAAGHTLDIDMTKGGNATITVKLK